VTAHGGLPATLPEIDLRPSKPAAQCVKHLFKELVSQTPIPKLPLARLMQAAVSPISKSAARTKGEASAGLETRDTADLEVCGTSVPVQYPV
jgi:hypothetical protein